MNEYGTCKTVKRVQGSGFRVQGSGLKVQGSGFKVQVSGFTVEGNVLKTF